MNGIKKVLLKQFFTTFLIGLISTFSLRGQVKLFDLKSPDKAVLFSVFIINGKVNYKVQRGRQPVINSSNLGLIINGEEISNGNSFNVISKSKVRSSYPTRGLHSLANNVYNEVRLRVTSPKFYEIDIRVFNDGAAFRYIVPNHKEVIVDADMTTFSIPAGSTIWSQNSITNYEGNYVQQKIEDVKAGQIVGPPMTMKLPGGAGYASITEAGLKDFAGMSLVAQGANIYKASLTGVTQKKSRIESSWRVVLIGKTLNQLVNSDIISNVSPKPDTNLFPKGYSTEWIKPGKSVWSWLAGNGEVSFLNMERFSDWAGSLGFDYNLVDEGWARWKDGNKDHWAMMKDLVDYSRQRNVKIWAWKAYPDRAGVPGIKDSLSRVAFFKQCKEIGIAGLKIDFFDTESQEVIDFYQAALRDAAKFQLMLNFHGSNKPTGESRTWPNEMSREGVIGLENNTNWAKHNTTLPFTRFLAGHADYTPLGFTENVKGTTLTHQVAAIAAFNSPFMCLGADPEVLLNSQVKDMVKQIPIVWDETIVLPKSEIGELVLLAKRKGRDWYLIGLNGESPKTLSIKLSFLSASNYQTECLEDFPQWPDQTVQKSLTCNSKDAIQITMSAGGGFIGRFHKQANP